MPPAVPGVNERHPWPVPFGQTQHSERSERMLDRIDDRQMRLAASVARRHYLGEESQLEIGRSLEISRFKVARLLALAKSAGLVHIEVRDPPKPSDALADELRAKHGLQECVVVRGEAGAAHGLGEAAALLLQRTLVPGDVLGLPWARTVHGAVRALDRLPPVTVVQLCGSMIIPGQSTPFDVVQQAAALSAGEAFVFHAPLIMPTRWGAEEVRRQSDVERAMAAISRVTVALCSIGAWLPGASTIFDVVGDGDRSRTRDAGVVGETMGVFFDADGAPSAPELAGRLVTITSEQLEAIPTVVATAHGTVRAPATRAALRGEIIDRLVVDEPLARELVAR